MFSIDGIPKFLYDSLESIGCYAFQIVSTDGTLITLQVSQFILSC